MAKMLSDDLIPKRMVRAWEKVKELTSFRDKNRVHLRDLIDVGLVDRSRRDRVPATLSARLQELLDNTDGQILP
jgi:hypothetical protein